MFTLFSGQKPSIPHIRSQKLSRAWDETEEALETTVEFDHYLDSSNVPYSDSQAPVAPRKTHQRSLTDYNRPTSDLPPLVIPNAQPPLPTESSSQSTDSPRPSELPRQRSPLRSLPRSSSPKSEAKVQKITNWFQGESEPLKLGFIPSHGREDQDTQEDKPTADGAQPGGSRHRKSMSTMSLRPAMASRFSFFSSKLSLAKLNSTALDPNDELLSMDTSTVLNSPTTSDPISSTTLKYLQQQAEALLSRLQCAYKERTQALRELEAEKETLIEEMQGADTRAQHLKMQLDNMAAKLAEQDEAMMSLVDELAQEKIARQEEEARKPTVRLVDRDQLAYPGSNFGRMSLNTISDLGFESEDDSSGESIFSQRNGMHSPTMSMSSVSTNNSPELYQAADFPMTTSQSTRPRMTQASMALKGARPASHPDPVLNPCSACTNVRSSETSGMIGALGQENNSLKHRVEELERALDGCLDVVGRLGA